MVKTWEDYIDQMCDLFPEIKREDVEHIIKYGTSRLMRYVTNGFDFAVDYKLPRSSVFFSQRSLAGDSKLKMFQKRRKDVWLENELKRAAEKKDK